MSDAATSTDAGPTGTSPAQATMPPPQSGRVPRGRLAAAQVLLFIWLWGAFCFFSHGPSWGPLSRLNLVMALVDDGTVVVDSYHENTGDNAISEGHFYHEKAPGGAFLGVVPYRVYAWLAPRPPFEPWAAWSRYTGRALYVVGCFSTALLSALAGVILFRLAWGLFGNATAAFGAVVLYAFATNVFIYSAQFQSHQMAGALAAAAFYLAWRARRTAGRHQALRLLGAGLCLGWLVAVEFQDVFIAVALGVYLLVVLPRRRRIAWLVPGAVLPLALVMLFNWACFDSPFSPGYAHLWGGWDRLHRGALLGFGAPRLPVLLRLLAGPRLGLLVYTPAVALAVVGAALWWRRHRHRAELVLATAVWGTC